MPSIYGIGNLLLVSSPACVGGGQINCMKTLRGVVPVEQYFIYFFLLKCAGGAFAFSSPDSLSVGSSLDLSLFPTFSCI